MKWSTAQLVIPSSSLVVVLLWLGAFLSDAWRVTDTGVGASVVHVGLGRIVFSKLCTDGGSSADVAACLGRVSAFKRLLSDKTPPPSHEEDADDEQKTIRVSISSDNIVACTLWNCQDKNFRLSFTAVLFLGFFSSLLLGVAVIFVVLDSPSVAKLSIAFSLVLGIVALSLFVFSPDAKPEIDLDAVSFFQSKLQAGLLSTTALGESGEAMKAAIEQHKDTINRTEKLDKSKIDFPLSNGFAIACAAVLLSLVPLVASLLAKPPIPGEADEEETWTAAPDADDEENQLNKPLLSENEHDNVGGDSSKSPSVISVHSTSQDPNV